MNVSRFLIYTFRRFKINKPTLCPSLACSVHETSFRSLNLHFWRGWFSPQRTHGLSVWVAFGHFIQAPYRYHKSEIRRSLETYPSTFKETRI